MTQENAVKVIEPITGTALVVQDVFTPEGVEVILAGIKAEVAKHKPDLSTVTSRKAIASTAYKVSQSKILLDDLGKSLVEGWKTQSKKVDEQRKMVRDELDKLRDETRKPLDEWEATEAAKVEAEKALRLMNEAHDAALVEDAMRKRDKEIEALKAEAARIQAEKEAKEAAELAAKEAAAAAERAEVERKANEERIRQEAADKAKLEAEAAAAAQIAEAEKKEREAMEAVARAEREKVEAAELAEKEKQAAILAEQQKAAAEALRVENERKAKDAAEAARAAAEKAEAEKKAANVQHQKDVNNKAVAALVNIGITAEIAKSSIIAIAKGNVPSVTINY